jgi:hypothetical protein
MVLGVARRSGPVRPMRCAQERRSLAVKQSRIRGVVGDDVVEGESAESSSRSAQARISSSPGTPYRLRSRWPAPSWARPLCLGEAVAVAANVAASALAGRGEGTEKLTATHLERTGLVYIRQSSLAQVRNNAESTAASMRLPTRPSGWAGSGPRWR